MYLNCVSGEYDFALDVATQAALPGSFFFFFFFLNVQKFRASILGSVDCFKSICGLDGKKFCQGKFCFLMLCLLGTKGD